MDFSLLRTSITIGMMATTRWSTAAVVQVVQPRLEPPATTKWSTWTLPPTFESQNAVIVSMARTALFVMGRRSGQLSSPPRRNLSQVYAMMASSLRDFVSPANVSGSFGTMRNSATTVLVVRAVSSRDGSGFSGGGELMLPPVMNRKPVDPDNLSGRMMVSQCFQIG